MPQKSIWRAVLIVALSLALTTPAKANNLDNAARNIVIGIVAVTAAIAVVITMVPFMFLFASMIRLQNRSRFPSESESESESFTSSPSWISLTSFPSKILGLIGFLSSAFATFLSLIPPPEEPHKLLYLLKILGSAAALIALGFLIFHLGQHRNRHVGAGL